MQSHMIDDDEDCDDYMLIQEEEQVFTETEREQFVQLVSLLRDQQRGSDSLIMDLKSEITNLYEENARLSQKLKEKDEDHLMHRREFNKVAKSFRQKYEDIEEERDILQEQVEDFSNQLKLQNELYTRMERMQNTIFKLQKDDKKHGNMLHEQETLIDELYVQLDALTKKNLAAQAENELLKGQVEYLSKQTGVIDSPAQNMHKKLSKSMKRRKPRISDRFYQKPKTPAPRKVKNSSNFAPIANSPRLPFFADILSSSDDNLTPPTVSTPLVSTL
ncbi:hypothetical protein PCE1_000421 [Barthelona sp. PCE]